MSEDVLILFKYFVLPLLTTAYLLLRHLRIYIIAKEWMYPAAAASSEEGYDAFKFLLSACLLGWANGKYQVVRLGPSACVEFCKTNVVPMLLFVGASAKAGAWDTPVWAMLTAAYVYFGYVA